MERILKYFQNLSDVQQQQFAELYDLYVDWNAKINVVSRKDIEDLYLRHVLHSLGIAKVLDFKNGTSLLDVGTGGGFPGIPLAILYPKCSFHLVDSINKKITVVKAISEAIGLQNVKATHCRVEAIDDTYDFVVSRAVTSMPDFVKWVKGKVKKKSIHDLKNGILYLKGGDLTKELITFEKATTFNLSDYFEEDFFDTKKVVHLPIKNRLKS